MTRASRVQLAMLQVTAAALGMPSLVHLTDDSLLGRVLTSINLCQQPGSTSVPWRVYLLRCSNEALYCGATVNMAERLKKHKAGTASKFTRSFLPVNLAMVSLPMQHGIALSLEASIKRCPADKKLRMLEQFVDQRLLDEFRRSEEGAA